MKVLHFVIAVIAVASTGAVMAQGLVGAPVDPLRVIKNPTTTPTPTTPVKKK